MQKKHAMSEESLSPASSAASSPDLVPVRFASVTQASSGGLFDTVFQEVDEAILIADIDPTAGSPIITDVNCTFEEWTGYGRDGVCGFSLYSLLDVTEAGARAMLEGAIAASRPAEVDVFIVGRDGAVFPVHLTMRPVISANDGLRYTCILRRTEALASHAVEIANRQRDVALRAKEELLARVSHELRTPLNGILGLSEILKGEMLGDMEQEQYRDYATDIHMAGTKLLWRIEELLQLKLVEDADWVPEDRIFNACDVARGTVQLLEPYARSEDVIISSMFTPNLPRITADQGGFRQIVHSLIGNAIAAAKKGTVIFFELGLSSVGELCVSTSFDGDALGAEGIQDIFDGCRDDSVYDSADGGDSMGLYLAQRITRRHGGRLEVTNAAEASDAAEAVDPSVSVMAVLPAHRVG